MPISYQFVPKGAVDALPLLEVEKALNKAVQGRTMAYPIGEEDSFRDYPLVSLTADTLLAYMNAFSRIKGQGLMDVKELDAEVWTATIKAPHDDPLAMELRNVVDKTLEAFVFRAWWQAKG